MRKIPRSTDSPRVKAAKLMSCHNGMLGDKARGFLDGFGGIPPRTDAAFQDSYDTGWLEGALISGQEAVVHAPDVRTILIEGAKSMLVNSKVIV